MQKCKKIKIFEFEDVKKKKKRGNTFLDRSAANCKPRYGLACNPVIPLFDRKTRRSKNPLGLRGFLSFLKFVRSMDRGCAAAVDFPALFKETPFVMSLLQCVTNFDGAAQRLAVSSSLNLRVNSQSDGCIAGIRAHKATLYNLLFNMNLAQPL